MVGCVLAVGGVEFGVRARCWGVVLVDAGQEAVPLQTFAHSLTLRGHATPHVCLSVCLVSHSTTTAMQSDDEYSDAHAIAMSA